MSSITIAPPTLNWGQAYELRINPDPFDSPLEPLPGSADQPAARTRDTECDLYLGSIQGLFVEQLHRYLLGEVENHRQLLEKL